MVNKMLIDASHPEETRVVVTRGNRVEEFDFESASRKQLRGNIYLAKVTRVEPSLQAAFVDFGGNRHGFLAFSEIHPDYYQIPVADREALLADEARRARREEEDEENGSRSRGDREGGRSEGGRDGQRRGRRDRGRRPNAVAKDAGSMDSVSAEASELETASAEDASSGQEFSNAEFDDTARLDGETATSERDDEAFTASDERPSDEAGSSSVAESDNGELTARGSRGDDQDDLDDEPHEEEVIEQMGGGDALEEVPSRNYYARRQYKIQEVIKRRQILLIQVVKEERGNKGAALTTYLSLAGRYSVLMPNTARGGGISRKITNGPDRKRLKEVVGDLEVPEGMGVILRTAGASRTKPEIKRDFEYLLRVWEKVRELTLQSTAPALVYEEGSLVKRAIRDLYSKDIEDIQVAGEAGFREAKDFMRMLMPSHSRMVQLYREPQPLFARFAVESQLDAMFSNTVTLRSGGYIVINQTEALVSIDVNSGRSTREHNIEDTALKTNMEAAEEVARQLRLRDLAGLIVIDFIDMEENRNNRSVERKMKDCLKDDRARIQIGRISHFGLLEMSRQRIRTGVLESSTVPCLHCGGTGFLRSTPSIALQLLRAIEDAMLRTPHHNIIVRTRTEVALYVLNHKRANLGLLEEHSGVSILIQADETVLGTTYFVVERGEFVEAAASRPPRVIVAHAQVEDPEDDYVEELEAEEASEDVSEADIADETGEETDGQGRKRGRRRRRRGGRERDDAAPAREALASDDEAQEDLSADDAEDEIDAEATPTSMSEEETQRRRRRRRRGGRRNRRERDGSDHVAGEASETEAGVFGGAMETSGAQDTDQADRSSSDPIEIVETTEAFEIAATETGSEALPVKAKRGRAKKANIEKVDALVALEPAIAAKPKRGRTKKAAAASDSTLAPEAAMERGALESQPETDMTAPAAPELSAVDPTPVADAPAHPISPPPAPKPAPAPERVVDPNAPKRTGWWSRAKQALGGE